MTRFKFILRTGLVQLTLILALLVRLSAQQSNFIYYDKGNGINQSHIEVLFEDSRGYIWVGTESSGINVWNGLKFVDYSTENGLPDNKIRAIHEDRNGYIWIGTKSGYVTRFDGKEFVNYGYKQGLDDNHVISIVSEAGGLMWLATQNGGIYKFVNNRFVKVPLTNDTTHITIDVMYAARNGQLWIGTRKNGVYIKKGDKFVNITAREGLCNNKINCITEDRLGNMWIGTRYGVSCYNGWNFANFYHSNGLVSSYITAIDCDSKGNLWIGSYGYGACMFNGKKFETITAESGLSNNFISEILVDKADNVWFGTNGGGISCLTGEFLYHFDSRNGLPDKPVLKIVQGDDNQLWFGTTDKGIYHFTEGKFIRLDEISNTFSNNVTCIYKDKEGRLLIGTSDNGFGIYKDHQVIMYNTSNGLVGNNIDFILQDIDGYLWIGSYGNGISIFDGKQFHNLTKTNGLLSDKLKAITEDAEGNVWIGTEDEGILMVFKEYGARGIINGGGMDYFNYVNIKSNFGLSSNNISAFHFDDNGCLWIGTVDGGLGRFDGKRIVTFTQKDGLSSDNITFIAEDSKGNLWIGTDQGVNTVQYVISTRTANITNLSLNSGFHRLQGRIICGLEDKAGNIWFSGINGISVFVPEKYHPVHQAPIIHLTGVQLYSQETDWRNFCDSVSAWNSIPVQPELSYNKNHLNFDFFATDQAAPGAVKYQWMLKGLDNTWHEPSLQNTCTYSYIPYGKYTFMVKAIGYSGMTSEKPAELSFEILPPFWANWKFYVLIAVIIIILFLVYWRFKHFQLIREKKVLEDKVEERTKLLQEEKDVVERQKNQLTRQKQLLEQVNKELIKLSLVASKTSNSVVIFDADTNIEWANEGFSQMYDYSLEEFKVVFGKSIYETSNNPNIYQAIRRCIETKGPIDYVSQLTTKAGVKKWLQTTLTPALDEYDNIEKFIAVESDITKIKEAEAEIARQKKEVEVEKEKADTLLLNILPQQTADELKSKGFAVPRYYRSVSVMFSDIKEFTKSCENLTPKQIVTELHSYFAMFDEMVEQHFVEKIKTIGDAYMCVGGVPIRNRTHPFNTILAGLQMQRAVKAMNEFKKLTGKPVWELRLGIHTGDVVAGVVGKKKFAYDVWGDTVNVASRMEEAGEVGRVNISSSTYTVVKDHFVCEYRGKIEIKNRGFVDMYFVECIRPEYSINGHGLEPNETFLKFLAK